MTTRPSPWTLDSKYDTDTNADGEENENPIESLLTAAQQSRHHHGARGKYGRHLDNETREFIVRLRCDQEAKSNTIQQALADMGKTVNVKTIDRILAQQRKGKNDLLPVRRPRMAQYTAEGERYITELQDAHNEWTYNRLRAAWKDKYHRTMFQTSKILVMDGVSWHHTALIRQTLEGNPVTHRIERLPPYSPHINAIEYCLSRWKADIRKEEHTRTSNLRQQIEAQKVRITDGYVARCTDHVYRYYQHCIEKRPLVTPLPDVPETPPPAPSTP